MLDFGALKCELLYARDASFSIKLLCEMRIIGVKLLNNVSIVETRVKNLR